MRKSPLAIVGASWLAMTGAAVAQTAPVPTTTEDRDARISALEQELHAIEDQLNDLKASTAADSADIRQAQARAPLVTLNNGRPTIATPDGNFSFAVRGLAQFDAAHYDDHGGSPTDLASGTNFRRARLGIEGTIYHDWNWNLTAEFGGSGAESPQLNQAWVEYAGWRPFGDATALRLRIGAWATPANLEDATSNTDGLFLERPAIAELVRGVAAGDGRSGAGAFVNGEHWYASAALTGAVVGTATPAEFDEQTGYLLRAAFLPIHGDGYGVHLGVNVSGVIDPADTAAGPAVSKALRLRERPELRVDGTRLVDTGAIPASGLSQYGLEVGGFWNSFYLAGEWSEIDLDRSIAGLSDPSFTGWYVQGAWTLTGEHRQWSAATGGFQGIRPAHAFDSAHGQWGAWEAAARYSVLDLNDDAGMPGFAAPLGGIRGGEQDITTLGLNWYPNRVVRFLLDYQWASIDRLNAAGLQIGEDFQAVSLRSQVAF